MRTIEQIPGGNEQVRILAVWTGQEHSGQEELRYEDGDQGVDVAQVPDNH